MSPVRAHARSGPASTTPLILLEPVIAATRRPAPSGPRRSAGDRLRRRALATAAAGWADFSPAADPRMRPAS
ncbi:hypothetical protein BU198_40355 [Streptomyces sp. CBMA156]|nr:hypothetical protein [Streptomyces sp. CBMA156]MBD0676781.1 hypothetical protein [Streptomyces sp. CBMA156]